MENFSQKHKICCQILCFCEKFAIKFFIFCELLWGTNHQKWRWRKLASMWVIVLNDVLIRSTNSIFQFFHMLFVRVGKESTKSNITFEWLTDWFFFDSRFWFARGLECRMWIAYLGLSFHNIKIWYIRKGAILFL